MPVEHGFSGMGIVGCEGGFPEGPKYRSAGEVGRLRSLAVLECMFGRFHVLKGVRGCLRWQGSG